MGSKHGLKQSKSEIFISPSLVGLVLSLSWMPDRLLFFVTRTDILQPHIGFLRILHCISPAKAADVTALQSR